MSEKHDYDFSPALEKSPCSDCPVLQDQIENSNIVQGLATIVVSELCPDYVGRTEPCIIQAMRNNQLLASQIDIYND